MTSSLGKDFQAFRTVCTAIILPYYKAFRSLHPPHLPALRKELRGLGSSRCWLQRHILRNIPLCTYRRNLQDVHIHQNLPFNNCSLWAGFRKGLLLELTDHTAARSSVSLFIVGGSIPNMLTALSSHWLLGNEHSGFISKVVNTLFSTECLQVLWRHWNARTEAHTHLTQPTKSQRWKK